MGKDVQLFFIVSKKKHQELSFSHPPSARSLRSLTLVTNDAGRDCFFFGKIPELKSCGGKIKCFVKSAFFVERCVIMGAYVWYGFLITIWCIFILFWDIFTFYISAYVHMLITALSNVNLHDGQGSPDSNLVNGKHTGHHSTNKPTKTLQRTQMQPQPAAPFFLIAS